MIRPAIAALLLSPALVSAQAESRGDEQAAAVAGTLDSYPVLQHLAGCWQSESGNDSELWLSPAANRMLGIAESRRDGHSVFFENLAIEQQDDGEVVYVAQPSNQSLTRFRMTEVSGDRIQFENPEHDFPTRITYRIDGDRLLASIGGESNGEWRTIAFHKQRISCQSLMSPD